jgi:hypothetical protein
VRGVRVAGVGVGVTTKTRILDSGPYWTNGKPLARLNQSRRNMAAALADHYETNEKSAMSNVSVTRTVSVQAAYGKVTYQDLLDLVQAAEEAQLPLNARVTFRDSGGDQREMSAGSTTVTISA